MADSPFGLSFSPGAPTGPNGQPANGQRPSPIQQAIQTLSLRIPRVAGASAFTAQPLLDSPGGLGLGGNPNSAAMLEQLRRMLFGGADQNGAGVTGFNPAPSDNGPSNGPDLAAIFSQIFGQPAGLPRDNSPLTDSGSGAPLGESGSGAPLPAQSPSFPLPNFVPGKDRKEPEPWAAAQQGPAPMAPEPDYGNDTKMI